MYSYEFMKYLLNYQKPAYDSDIYKTSKSFNTNPLKFLKLAEVLLLNKK